MAKAAVQQTGLSIKSACASFLISETCYRYQPKLGNENDIIADWLLAITEGHRSWGFKWNHKRIYRIYRELELNLRIKPNKRLKREKPEPLLVPTSINKTWSMDFMHDQLSDGRSYRTFNVIDNQCH